MLFSLFPLACWFWLRQPSRNLFYLNKRGFWECLMESLTLRILLSDPRKKTFVLLYLGHAHLFTNQGQWLPWQVHSCPILPQVGAHLCLAGGRTDHTRKAGKQGGPQRLPPPPMETGLPRCFIDQELDVWYMHRTLTTEPHIKVNSTRKPWKPFQELPLAEKGL